MKPFLKWAGGKAKLLPEIEKRLPREAFSTYIEPFVGGGAVFGHLATSRGPFASVLNDSNAELMNVFRMVKTTAPAVIAGLKSIKHSKAVYAWIRNIAPIDLVGHAVRFIYLNRTCFNGLYRVNKEGKFNVPIGSYKNPIICDEELIKDWALVLGDSRVTLQNTDFQYVLFEHGGHHSFAYCDPPYLPASKTADFTSYTADKFALRDHERLARALKGFEASGGMFLLSEGDHPEIRNLFKGYRIDVVESRRSVSASAASRASVKELLIRNY